jgi:hypothetical protein
MSTARPGPSRLRAASGDPLGVWTECEISAVDPKRRGTKKKRTSDAFGMKKTVVVCARRYRDDFYY